MRCMASRYCYWLLVLPWAVSAAACGGFTSGQPALHPLPLQLGRFTLRDEGKTIAIGKVLRVPKRGGGAVQAE